MNDWIEERVIESAKYIISSRTTIRDTAKIFGASKSTIHKDLTERLPKINPYMAHQVKQIIDTNKAERHIRGGMATKAKHRGYRKNENLLQ